MSHRPALAATRATAALALLPCLLIITGQQDRAGADRADGRGSPFAHESVDRSATVPPAPDRFRPQPVPPPLGRRSGLGDLTAGRSGLRVTAFGHDSSHAADGAAVTAMPENAEENQEWLVRPTAGDAFLLQSLLLGTGEDTTGPLLLTADPDGSVYLSAERPGNGPEAAAEDQSWTFADLSAPLRWNAPDGRSAIRLRIHAHGGRCLLDQGYGERLTLGACDDPRAWWTAGGLTG
ncbi:hypothetical protein ABTY61_34545 [Kitasatospora sp. NPDC096128]|uniref:hypothetical protein n=1 Tax=Kitasatospora sp. NPDC096128 TaxID=3155547 RepID=UPI00331810BA